MALPPTPAPHRNARILSVIAATLIALACGTNYGFSAWSPQFATTLSLSATQINLIGNAGNLGMYAVGIPSGILIDTHGPRWGVLLGTVCLGTGYWLLKGAYDAAGEGYGMVGLCAMGFLTGVGSCSAFSASIKVCATNWPRHRGTATAFPLSGFGLSAFLFTAVSRIAFPDDTSGLLLLLGTGTFVMTGTGMVFLRMFPQGAVHEEEERESYKRSDSNEMRRSRSGESARHLIHDDDPTTETSSLVSTPTESLSSKPSPHHHAHHPNITGLALLHSPSFYLLFITLGLLSGVGLMTINNIGNTAKALWHHTDPSTPSSFIQQRQLMHVAIISVFSFLGRLGSGIGSDYLVHHDASRFWTLVTSAGIFTSAQIVGLTLGNPNHLFLLSALTGLAYGALFGVFPALVADAFGPTGMGINWGAMTMAPVITGNIYNLAYGRILDSHSIIHEGGDGKDREQICDLGRECYASAYWLTLASSIVGVAWSLWCIRREKVMRTRRAAEGRDREA
ncbi:hypothetical protein B0A48_11702 [Cryoendolithus antarcticus]|uniref:Uncharacterized protein n=1 Tax=Cryoendolithus antarcticus TaxID=1507870 RepID=A0A1V8SSW5_9PEZI|nr:hypothetical protein B0A48_11702 [Cryoendolithus antarcticus]